jgi:hypothetical protein
MSETVLQTRAFYSGCDVLSEYPRHVHQDTTLVWSGGGRRTYASVLEQWSRMCVLQCCVFAKPRSGTRATSTAVVIRLQTYDFNCDDEEEPNGDGGISQ